MQNYYRDNKVAIVASKIAYLVENPFDIDSNKTGNYIITPNRKLKFKEFLSFPTENPEDEEPICYFDSYQEVLDYGLVAYIVDKNNVYKDDDNSIGMFNAKYSTSFKTFEEMYNYSLMEEDENGNEYGLGYVANVVSNPITLM